MMATLSIRADAGQTASGSAGSAGLPAVWRNVPRAPRCRPRPAAPSPAGHLLLCPHWRDGANNSSPRSQWRRANDQGAPRNRRDDPQSRMAWRSICRRTSPSAGGGRAGPGRTAGGGSMAIFHYFQPDHPSERDVLCNPRRSRGARSCTHSLCSRSGCPWWSADSPEKAG